MLTRAAKHLADLGESQSEIARKLGTTRQCVHNWQTGTIPDGAMMLRLAQVLKIPLAWWGLPAR
jgi:transcriptional regulator with XRE-family HTH domain